MLGFQSLVRALSDESKSIGNIGVFSVDVGIAVVTIVMVNIPKFCGKAEDVIGIKVVPEGIDLRVLGDTIMTGSMEEHKANGGCDDTSNQRTDIRTSTNPPVEEKDLDSSFTCSNNPKESVGFVGITATETCEVFVNSLFQGTINVVFTPDKDFGLFRFGDFNFVLGENFVNLFN